MAWKKKKSSSSAATGASVPFFSLFKYADAFDILLMVIGSLAAIINGFAYPAMILTRGQVIDNFGQSFDKSRVMNKVSHNSLVFVYIALVAWLASYLEVSCWMLSGERQATKIRLKYLRSILRQDVEFFETGGTSTSDVANSISADTMLVQEAISEKAGNFIRNASQFLGCYLVGFTQAWRLSVVLLPFTPFMVLPGILYGKVIAKFELEKQGTYNKAGRIAEEAISSIRTVYSFVGESKTLANYCQSLEPTVKLGLKQGFAKGLALASGGITFAIWSFMAWYGSTLVNRGQANGAQVITTGLAFINGGRALGFAVSNVKIFAEGRVAAAKIYQIISRVPSIDIDACQGKQLTEVAGRLQLRNVEYAYACRPDIPVLKGLTLDIPEGKKVALVGSSGSGKSTIVALLERFYDPAQGAVLLDGNDIRTLQLRWYRSQIGLVSQEPALFATSIKGNILYGKEDATMDEVVEAAKLSNAQSFIAGFPDGYETQVGERGVQLSGGQKQRIAIARALIKKPPILLLDEATSALDTESEAVVQSALEEASVGRTTVIVAHRLSTIRNADLIAVLESGKLVELGRHEELMEKGGAYAALASLQATAPRKRSIERHNSQDKIERYNSKEKMRRHSSLGRFSSQEMRRILEVFGARKSRKQLEVDSLPETKEQPKEPKASFWKLVSLCKPEWKQGLKGLLGAIVFGLIQPVYSFLFGAMVTVYYDRNHDRMERKIQRFCFMFAGIAAATFISNLVNHYNFATVGELLTKRVRQLMLASVLTFEVGWFDRDENTSGAVCSRLQNEANMIRALIIDRISLLVQTFSAVCTSFIMGLVVSWRMGLLMVALQPLLVFCYYIKLVFLKGFTKKAAKAQEDASHIASEAVSLHRTVTAFSSQDRVLGFMQSKLQAAVEDNKKRANMAGFGLGLAHFVLYASWGLQFWFGGQLFVHGKASLQDVFQVFFVFLSTGRVLAEALSLTPDLAKGPAAIDAVFSIINRKTEINPDDKRLDKPSRLRGALELCNVSFAYPSRPDIMIFSNFSLKVPAGKTVALVGQSGSGKSTVIGLVERFYDPLQGAVKIDGRDIKSLHLRTLRRQIGLVGQEPTLFAASILDNIVYGLEEGSWKMDEVVEAAKVANAHSFISALPEGYATYAGEKGLQLSGGQKQRIAIARAVLKNPTILLLDEATSALDTESEHLVQEALNRMMVGRTTVIVAHRLSTIKGCDCIAVVQNGAIVEEGTHEELLGKGERGAYYSLVHLQQQSSVA